MIAMACGWYYLTEGGGGMWAPSGWVYGRDKYGSLVDTMHLPPYTTSLDAMAEAETFLLPAEKEFYKRQLARTGTDPYFFTAQQRCSAFLLTIALRPTAKASQRLKKWKTVTLGPWQQRI